MVGVDQGTGYPLAAPDFDPARNVAFLSSLRLAQKRYLFTEDGPPQSTGRHEPEDWNSGIVGVAPIATALMGLCAIGYARLSAVRKSKANKREVLRSSANARAGVGGAVVKAGVHSVPSTDRPSSGPLLEQIRCTPLELPVRKPSISRRRVKKEKREVDDQHTARSQAEAARAVAVAEAEAGSQLAAQR